MAPVLKHKHTRAEKAHLRAVKRRSGPSAIRRKLRREGLQRSTVSPPDSTIGDDLSPSGADDPSQQSVSGETVAAEEQS